ncbi:MAG: 23S rRNA (guanosine(2251)-2'-O)-methyltransferase RlmB [Actinomycetia bacterium]|nr:23S rRNA (guanosine(2251)-2'-O)-methyltransferase RlmB [Actinomycetes bacterium]
MNEIVIGKNAVLEILKSKRKINKIYFEESSKGSPFYLEILKKIKKDIEIEHLTPKEMEKKAGTNKHQKIAAEVEPFKYQNLSYIFNKNSEGKSILVLLDGISDPRNFGAILRVCEAAGVDGVIIRKKRSVRVTSTVYKTSSGAVNSIPIIQVSNLSQSIRILKKEGYWVIGADLKGETAYFEYDYDKKTVLVLGSEGKGISTLLLKMCDVLVSIPMAGKVSSLNVSVACGVILYEMIRRRQKKEY